MSDLRLGVSASILNDAKVRRETVLQRIGEAASRVGRAADEIQLVGVAKRQPRERILAAVLAGIRTLGQSYIQEARNIRPEIEAALVAADRSAGEPGPWPPKLEWRMVGRLQRNKAGLAVRLFEAIDSVDRLELATTLSRRAATEGVEIEVLLQVSLCDEPQKGGCEPDQLLALAEAVVELPNLRLAGLMTVPAASTDPEDARPTFAALRELRERLGSVTPSLRQSALSMGMSGDLEVAVEEGATLVRVGTAVFGERIEAGARGSLS